MQFFVQREGPQALGGSGRHGKHPIGRLPRWTTPLLAFGPMREAACDVLISHHSIYGLSNLRTCKVHENCLAKIAAGSHRTVISPLQPRVSTSLASPCHAHPMANPVEQLSEHESYPDKPRQSNIVVLNERRRAALAEIDNAPFSCALLPLFTAIPSHLLQLVPRQSLFGRRGRLLYRRVRFISLPRTTPRDLPSAMTSSLSTLARPCSTLSMARTVCPFSCLHTRSRLIPRSRCPHHLAIYRCQGCHPRRKLVRSAHLWLACGRPRS